MSKNKKVRSKHYREGYRAFEPNFTKEPPVALQGTDLEDWNTGYLEAKQRYGFEEVYVVNWGGMGTSTWG